MTNAGIVEYWDTGIMIEEWGPNPDLGTATLIHSVIARTCKVRGNLTEKSEIASVSSQ
jgi:hypothetical protein